MMTHTFNGLAVAAHSPISAISVNKFNVAYRDGGELKTVTLTNLAETRALVSWLLSLV